MLCTAAGAESPGLGGEQQPGGSSACHPNVYALALAQALVDWFSSAEYGELQWSPKPYKGIVN